MKLIDLKRSKPPKSKGDGTKAATIGPSYDERPYNLRFTLEGPELEKLSLTPSSFANMEPVQAVVLLDPINIREIHTKSTDPYDKNRNQSVEFQILSISMGDMTAKKGKKFDTYNDQQKKGPGE